MQTWLIGVVAGIVVAGGAVLAAYSFGWLRIGAGSKAGSAPALRNLAHLKCELAVEEKPGAEYADTPRLRLFATIVNEGTTMVQAMKGHWKVVTPDKVKHPAIRIQRSALEPNGRYLESYRIDDDLDHAGSRTFDVEVEFEYVLQPEEHPRHYSARFRYDRRTRAVARL